MRFAEMTAPEIRGLARDATLVVAPIAACEQHSRHLPVFTDSILVGAVADGVERRPGRPRPAPARPLARGERAPPPLRRDAHGDPADLRADARRAADPPAPRRLPPRPDVLNGHGGNIDPLRVALRRLDVAFPGAVLTGAAYWDLAAAELAALCEGPRKEMGHACEIETSMVLHLRPDLVRTRPDPRRPRRPPRRPRRACPGPATSAAAPTTAPSATPSRPTPTAAG